MDQDEQRHLEKLQKVLTRRLRVLELQAARLGGNAPPDVLLEIEDLRESIAEVDAQLSEAIIVPVPTPSNMGTDWPEKTLHIVLNIDYSKWNPDLQAAALRAFAAVMDVSPDKVKIMDVQPGSVKVILRIPEDAAERLLEFYDSGHPIIQDLYIESLVDEHPTSVVQDATSNEPLEDLQSLQEQQKELPEDLLKQRLKALQEHIVDRQKLWLEEQVEQVEQLDQRIKVILEQNPGSKVRGLLKSEQGYIIKHKDLWLKGRMGWLEQKIKEWIAWLEQKIIIWLAKRKVQSKNTTKKLITRQERILEWGEQTLKDRLELQLKTLQKQQEQRLKVVLERIEKIEQQARQEQQAQQYKSQSNKPPNQPGGDTKD
jgi:hypothetical protein